MAYTVLSGLAEKAETILNSTPEETWEAGYKLGAYVTPEISVDPITQIEQVEEKPKLFIVPMMVSPDIGESQGRRQKISLTIRPAVSICLVCPFKTTGLSTHDVAPWDEVKKILNLRDTIDIILSSADWSPYTLNEVTAEPAQEISLKTRVFFTVTEYMFEGALC